jgi:hypothetical protein
MACSTSIWSRNQLLRPLEGFRIHGGGDGKVETKARRLDLQRQAIPDVSCHSKRGLTCIITKEGQGLSEHENEREANGP